MGETVYVVELLGPDGEWHRQVAQWDDEVEAHEAVALFMQDGAPLGARVVPTRAP